MLSNDNRHTAAAKPTANATAMPTRSPPIPAAASPTTAGTASANTIIRSSCNDSRTRGATALPPIVPSDENRIAAPSNTLPCSDWSR